VTDLVDIYESEDARRKLRSQLEFVFRGAAVKRWHVESTLQIQTDGAHSFGVAWFCYLLAGGKPSVNLLMAALSHDLAEQVVGDVPGRTKRQLLIGNKLEALENEHLSQHGMLFFLTEKEHEILHWADTMEAFMFTISEARLGNRNAVAWYNNICRWWGAHRSPNSWVEEMKYILQSFWEEAVNG
jgi:5'-deoxynucleotidase YfbR-like HD superfamily hydrolase